MLPMIHWQIELFYGYLLIQFCWSKHWGYSFSCEMVVEWQIYVQPLLHFFHSDGCKKGKMAYYWTIKHLSQFEFGGEETVIKTAESKNKIMISFYGSRDRTCVIEKQSSTKVVWNSTQHIQKKIWYSEGVGKKLEKQNLEISITAAYEQLCYLVDEILVKREWIMKTTYLLGKYINSRNPLNLTQTTCLRNGSWIYQKLQKFTQFCFSLCSVFSAAIPTG